MGYWFSTRSRPARPLARNPSRRRSPERSMTRPPIRALTIGVAEPHPVPVAALDGAVSRAQRARAAFQAEGYEVQTIRISTRPLLGDLRDWSAARILDYAL